MAAGYDDVLVFKSTGSTTEFFSTDCGKITSLAPATTWPAATQIVAGNFSRTFYNAGTQLLLYNAPAGVGDFCTVTKGVISIFHSQTNWQKTWTHIIPGQFGGTRNTDHFSDILFYDAAAGHAEFYTIEDDGGLGLLNSHDGWLKTWTHIVAGNFGSGSGNSDLLFYDANAGLGDFYSVENGGLGSVLSSNNGWRKTWTQIIPGDFGSASGQTDLLFYDSSGGTGEFYSVAKGALSALLSSNPGWNTNWSQIVPGQFGGTADTDLLFYASDTGDIAIYTVDHAAISLIGSQNAWSPGWTQILSGYFSSPTPPPSAPQAPSGLHVVSAESNSVNLAWTDNSDNENGFTISFHGTRSMFSDHSGMQSVAANVQVANLDGLRSGYVYSVSVVAFNDVGTSANSNVIETSPTPRTISVTRQGFGLSTVLVFTGSGFTPGGTLVVKVTAPNLTQAVFTETAQANGQLAASVQVPCVSGVLLTITVYEDANPTGTTANIIEMTC
jgi:hypothetical protein